MWLWYLRTFKWECFAWSCFSHASEFQMLMNISQAIRSCLRLYLFFHLRIEWMILLFLLLQNNLNLHILFFLDRITLNFFINRDRMSGWIAFLWVAWVYGGNIFIIISSLSFYINNIETFSWNNIELYIRLNKIKFYK